MSVSAFLCPAHRPEPDAFDVVQSSVSAAMLLALIETLIARVYMVDPLELHAPSRSSARIAFARQVAMYIAQVVCRLTMTEVGRNFGRDRTTVAHACEVIEEQRDDRTFDRTLELLVGILRHLRDVSQRASNDA